MPLGLSFTVHLTNLRCRLFEVRLAWSTSMATRNIHYEISYGSGIMATQLTTSSHEFMMDFH
jgi:hypothetical protein